MAEVPVQQVDIDVERMSKWAAVGSAAVVCLQLPHEFLEVVCQLSNSLGGTIIAQSLPPSCRCIACLVFRCLSHPIIAVDICNIIRQCICNQMSECHLSCCSGSLCTRVYIKAVMLSTVSAWWSVAGCVLCAAACRVRSGAAGQGRAQGGGKT